jgi:hypothetical protein
MQISERLFRRLVRDVDDQHRSAMVAFEDDQRGILSAAVDRRRFLVGAGVGGAAMAVTASTIQLPGFRGVAGAQTPSAKDLAIYAARIELVAVKAYDVAAKSGLVTTKAVGEAAVAFMAHHQEHANAFARIAGKQPTDIKENPKLLAEIVAAAGGLKSEKDALKLAFDLENGAAATYVFALGVLEDIPAIGLMSSILPIETAHAVVLGNALGLAPDAADYLPGLESDTKKLDPAKYPVG